MEKKDRPDDLVVLDQDTTSRPREEESGPKVGEWYWVSRGKGDDPDDVFEWIGCVVHVGSNYVGLKGVAGARSTHNDRIHFDEFEKRCRPEPNALLVIGQKIAEQRAIIAETTRQIASVVSRLRLGASSSGGETGALALYHGESMSGYKRELIDAKDKGLPELKETIECAAGVMRAWMQAEAIPLEAQMSVYETSVELIEKRIDGVEIYSGLVESAVVLQDGAPAAAAEPVHLFQRRHYMDEECLLDYDAGGMRFEQIGSFDAWLLRPDNLHRIMPFPRSVVAFRVRREKKESDDSFKDFVSFLFGEEDKDMLTFVYIRNGDRVAPVSTAIDFGEKLFPDADHQVMFSNSPTYAVMGFGTSVARMATEGEYLERERRRAVLEEKLSRIPSDTSEGRHERFMIECDYADIRDGEAWILWNRDTVRYDDISKHVKDTMEEHNRLVLFLQGLLDRSEVLHPHPLYKLWVGEDFGRAVKLVYDDDRALVSGEAPDFLTYQARVNEGMRVGSLCVGQDDFWARSEAAKYNRRLVAEYGHEKSYYMQRKRHRPEGDPGPGLVARVRSLRNGACSFEWSKMYSRRKYYFREDDAREVRCRLAVPQAELLRVEGYRPGDYKLFYRDPRTRAQYLKWAPLLLRAEEYHAGRISEDRSGSRNR